MCKYCDNWKNRLIEDVHKDKTQTELSWFDGSIIMNFGAIPHLYISWLCNKEALSTAINYCPWCGVRLSNVDVETII